MTATNDDLLNELKVISALLKGLYPDDKCLDTQLAKFNLIK